MGEVGEGEIWVLEPRRLAARMAAQRVADELGEELGGRVGLQVRFETRASRNTRVRFVTEGIFLREGDVRARPPRDRGHHLR